MQKDLNALKRTVATMTIQ